MKGKGGDGEWDKGTTGERRKVPRVLVWKADPGSEPFLSLIFSEGL